MSKNAICTRCKHCGPFNIYRGDDGSEQVLTPNAITFNMDLYMRCKCANTTQRNPISRREANMKYPCAQYKKNLWGTLVHIFKQK